MGCGDGSIVVSGSGRSPMASRSPIYGLMSAAVFVLGMSSSQAELSGQYPSPSHGTYKTLDGAILVRAIERPLPERTIVVCSDRPEFYLPRLRRFADYVFADKSFVIVDGRYPPTGLRLGGATFLYMGHVPAADVAKDCMRKYPELYSFFLEKKSTDRTTPLLLPNATRPIVVPVIDESIVDRRSRSKYKNELYFCFDNDYMCVQNLIVDLFRLRMNFCEQEAAAAICDDAASPPGK